VTKELSLWHKIKYLNLNIFRTRCCKPLIFQAQIIWCNRIHSLKYLRYATFGCKVIVIRKSEFVAKTQFLSFLSNLMYNDKLYDFRNENFPNLRFKLTTFRIYNFLNNIFPNIHFPKWQHPFCTIFETENLPNLQFSSWKPS